MNRICQISSSLLLPLAVAAAACSADTGRTDLREGNAIWFDRPTSSETPAPWTVNDFSATVVNADPEWEKLSLPIGNGSFGGAIMGSIARERVVLNEKTLWYGGPGTGAEEYWDMNEKVDPATLATIRRLLAEGKNAEASRLTSRTFAGKWGYDRSRFGCYTVMGEAYVTTGLDESAVTDYRRVLNIDLATAGVDFRAGDASYSRRFFCSYPDSVMVWRFTSDGARQDLVFSFDTPQCVDTVYAEEPGSLLWAGHLDGNNMPWALRVKVMANGGDVTPDPVNGTISVTGSDDVTFLLAGDTGYALNLDPATGDPAAYYGVNPVETVNAVINDASRKSYAQLYNDHLADYRELYDRVDFSLGAKDPEAVMTPTPARLEAYRGGADDPGLEETYFNFGRYLLIASSRPGTMPANLQGLWSNNIDGPWRVDYHNNINLQMNYWPATSTNLTECFAPLTDYVRSIVVPGRRTATDYYGARGWTAGISTNVFGFTAPLASGQMEWNYNPSAGPWLATQLWDYYDFTRDEEWLRNVGYDIIKESADFTSDLLVPVNGTYTFAPSYSPEHGECDLGATYANAVAREVLANAIEAAHVLGRDSASVAEWQEKLDNMYPYKVGQYGQLQEWYEDIDVYGDRHRHTNHLFGLHPGRSIDVNTDTILANACRETLRQRGDEATGWSMGWKLNHWARLQDGDHAYTLLRNLLRQGTSDNLWDVHPPFQIDGNFGGTAGMAELFLQSHTGKLHLLPALPSRWADSHMTGLLARGNFVTDIYAADGKLDYAVITSRSGGPLEVLYDGMTATADTRPGEKLRVTVGDGTLNIESI